MKFTKQEYADLHLLYGEARGNFKAAMRLYYFCGAKSAFM
jgi:hypothetical protein